jgi:hypothetical protein
MLELHRQSSYKMPKWDKGKANDERKKRCAKTTPQQNKGVNHVL